MAKTARGKIIITQKAVPFIDLCPQFSGFQTIAKKQKGHPQIENVLPAFIEFTGLINT
ncbi:hypothetical protein [Levilactobacillus zymae]|uniref:hypothetical protein n=1 Tax=Levilactobacillus zymae TaxID=267363 RepID=UPI00155F6749|nr:hypothetical protein [Levilactobacillus zymae]